MAFVARVLVTVLVVMVVAMVPVVVCLEIGQGEVLTRLESMPGSGRDDYPYPPTGRLDC